MVHCTKCGTENKEGTRFCVNCGASFIRMARRAKSPRDECFGLPSGGVIFGLFIGVIIILWGLTEVFGWTIDLGSFAIIIIGILMVAGSIYGLAKRR